LAVTPNEGKYKVWLTVKFSATNLCLLCSYTRLDGMQLKLCYFLRFGVLDRVIEHAGSWECKLEWSPKRTRTGWSIMKKIFYSIKFLQKQVFYSWWDYIFS
jgi:hypothetical protein